MKKVLSAILVLALTMGSMAVTANAAELENLTKRATSWEATSGDAAKAGDLDASTAWVADSAQATITMGIDIPLPMGYIEIDFGDTVANEFKIQVSSDAASWTDVVSETGNMKAKYSYEWTSATQRYVKIEILATDEDAPATIAEIVTRQNKNKEDTSTASAYPSSGVEIPDGSYLIQGEIIGNATGWGDNPATGAAAAFDGDISTFFDPLGTGNGWAGIDAGEPMKLTKIVIHPRADQLARYYGAEIDGSNDPDFADYTPIYVSIEQAPEYTYIEIDDSDFDDIGEFRYYRYYNTMSHGDVAEVELYGEPVDGTYAEAAPETEAPAAETPLDGTYMSMEKNVFEVGEPIMITAKQVGSDTDWIGLYEVEHGLPGAGWASTQWFYAWLAEDEAWAISDGDGPMAYQELPAGEYAIYYCFNDGYEVGQTINITIVDPNASAETEAEVVETEAETEPEVVETEAPETEAETEPEVVETEAPETEAEVVEEADAPQTFDFGVTAAIAAIVSLAGYALSKKR